jgi:ribosomal protein L7Ae-like RNA K-turn-binding protein
MEDKLLGLLGLARRAGKTTCGADAVRRDIQSGRARAVLLSNDASPRTAGGIQSACEKNGTACFTVPYDMAELGGSMGRGDTAVAAICDKGFAHRVSELCRGITGGIC